MKHLIPMLALVLSAALGAGGCGSAGGGGSAGGSAAQAKPTANGGSGAPNGQPPIPVAVEPAHRGPIASYYSATATLTPEKEAEILARVSGVIHELRAEEGDYVRQGEALLLIENDEYRLRLEQAEATRADVEARHRRAKEMLERGLVSPEEFDALASQLQSAKAQEELARLSLSYTEVVAPFSGRVVERLVDMGQNVSEGTPLFRLADFDPLLARVHVPSKEFKRLKPDQPVEVVLESTQERMPGHIKLVSPVIDRESGTIKVTIEIPQYPATTRPGDFAQVRVVTEQRPNCLLAPKIALVSDRGEQVVFVVADSAAERRVVEVGFEDDQSAEILDGLSDGERVVVKGQRSLKHGSPVKVMTDDIFTAQAPAAAEKAP